MAEINKGKIVCFIAQDAENINACFILRGEVFVKELKMFKLTDRDRYDNSAILIGMKKGDDFIGTVRVYEKEKGIWFGGRLAVRKNERQGNSSRQLVKYAEDIALQKGAKHFFAMVQKKNINFFKKLGWDIKDGPLMHHGILHYLMESGFVKSGKP